MCQISCVRTPFLLSSSDSKDPTSPRVVRHTCPSRTCAQNELLRIACIRAFFFCFVHAKETKIHLLCETPNKAKLCNFSLLFCLFWSLLLPVFGEEHGSEIFIKQIISVHVDCNLFQMFSLHATEQRFVRWKLFSWKLWAWPKLFCSLELTGKSFLESILDFFEDVIDEFYIWFLIFVSCNYYWSYFFLFSSKSIKYQKRNLTTASQIYDTSAASFPPLDLIERVMRQLKDHTSKSQILR